MYVSKIAEGPAESGASLANVQVNLVALAGGLDARFVEAGQALAEVYTMVERLVSTLEAITNALGHDAATLAIENMRATADRLARLPTVQADRRVGLAAIEEASAALVTQIDRVNRTLSFLRICGLNIKVAAAGAGDFSGFADTMFEKIDIGELEMGGIAREVELLATTIPAVLAIEDQLAAECAKVIPEVPRKLAEDALALQERQTQMAVRATEIAGVARDIRGRVGTALGALQIGDITRQRLEHVASGLELLEAALVEHRASGAGIADALEGHAVALLAAQAADAVEDFRREARLLAASLRGIAPSAAALLEIKNAGGPKAETCALDILEQSVAEVQAVTQRLREADAKSNLLSSEISSTAESLAQRLKRVHRVKSDVEQMAWNTDLRSNRMGNEGRGMAVVASEIRGFANVLETISEAIGKSFDTLSAAAGSIRDPQAGEGADAGQALADSLAQIRDGSRRMREGIAGLDGDATAVGDILRATTDKVDCEAEIGETLAELTERLAGGARPLTESPESATAALRAFLDTVARSYTMASERAIHVRFALVDESMAGEGGGEAPVADDDDEDDGLF